MAHRADCFSHTAVSLCSPLWRFAAPRRSLHLSLPLRRLDAASSASAAAAVPASRSALLSAMTGPRARSSPVAEQAPSVAGAVQTDAALSKARASSAAIRDGTAPPAPPGLAAAISSLDRSHAQSARYIAAVAAASDPNAPGAPAPGKLRQLWHDYGWVGVGTYLSVYVGTLGVLYIALSSGLVGGNQVMRLVEALGMRDHFPADISPKSSSFIMAWVATKLTEPARLALSVIITPRIARALGRAPPKSKGQAAKLVVEVAKEVVKGKKH